MKIHIRKIRPEGLECEETFPADSIGLAQQDGICFVLPVVVKAKITRAEDELLTEMSVESRYRSACNRCLEDITRDWAAHFSLNFDIEKNKEFIELDEDIRQEIILNVPTRILCSESCKGLCIDCGTNLNKKECEHKHAVVSGM